MLGFGLEGWGCLWGGQHRCVKKQKRGNKAQRNNQFAFYLFIFQGSDYVFIRFVHLKHPVLCPFVGFL